MYFQNIPTHENHMFHLNDEFNSHQCNREYSPTNVPNFITNSPTNVKQHNVHFFKYKKLN